MTGNINKITELFKIKYPIIQGGMIWHSGWRLAAAVSNAGGLGLLGSGSMHPETLKEHIEKCKLATDKPFGVNVPLIYPQIDEIIDIIIETGVKIIFTSAGSPKKYTEKLKSHGITVVHVIANLKFALKCVEAGVDAIVAEGFEAGGHNGIEETTTMVMIPHLKKHIDIPLIAAGGIASGEAIAAAIALGADGVQIGSLFAITEESSAHINFKEMLLHVDEGDTKLCLKSIGPTRLLKNDFYNKVKEFEDRGASPEELRELLGKRRSKKGMFEGDLEEGELEIGQVASSFTEILPTEIIMQNLVTEFNESLHCLNAIKPL